MEHSYNEACVLTSSPSSHSSRSDPFEHFYNTPVSFSPIVPATHHRPAPTVYRSNTSGQNIERLGRSKMSGFLSSEAERALIGEGEDTNTLFSDDAALYAVSGFQTPVVTGETTSWTHAHSDQNGFDYFHPYSLSAQEQYMLPVGPEYTAMAQPTYYNMPLRTMSMDTTSTMSYEQASLTSTMLPPSASSSIPQALASPPMLSAPAQISPSSLMHSRSPSPHASADLQRYGVLRSDGQTWRCSYPGCHSKAVFTRPCDLRKHFHRHEKKFFCRFDKCPQSEDGPRMAGDRNAASAGDLTSLQASSSQGGQGGIGVSGGFSSKKDRARHEAKHNPEIECEWDGCERLFSRVDNMKDHCRRIHLKEKERRRLSGRRSDEEQ